MRCKESSNRCQRLTYRLMADNSEKNISLCKEIVDGSWSNWTDVGECKGMERAEGQDQVEGLENYRCGEGRKTVERSCHRTVGGTFCKSRGKDYRGVLERRSHECYSGDCPGESSFKHFNFDNKFTLNVFQVWETLDTCDASEGETSKVKQVLKLKGKEYQRSIDCFNSLDYGWY